MLAIPQDYSLLVGIREDVQTATWHQSEKGQWMDIFKTGNHLTHSQTHLQPNAWTLLLCELLSLRGGVAVNEVESGSVSEEKNPPSFARQLKEEGKEPTSQSQVCELCVQ